MKLFNAFSLLSATFASASYHNNVADYQNQAAMGNIRGQQQRFMQDGEQEVVTKTEWTECIGQDVKDCARIVRTDARRHEIENLQVRIVAPHTNDQIIDTYMKVGISVNIMGEATGDKNDGIITYPYAWVSVEDGRTRELGPWDCSGLDSWTCCRKIRLSVPDKDIHGNHIECFAHENEPVYEEENLTYYTFVYAEASYQYEKKFFPSEEVLAMRALKNTTIAENVASLDLLLLDDADTITAGDLIQLDKDLMLATDALGLSDAHHLLGLLEDAIVVSVFDQTAEDVGVNEIEDDASLLLVEVPMKSTAIAEILLAVRHRMYDYAVTDLVPENYVWIYTSHNYKVWRAPQIGGAFNGHEEYVAEDVSGDEDYDTRKPNTHNLSDFMGVIFYP